MSLRKAIEQFNQWRGFKVGQGTINGYDLSLRHFCIFLRNPEIESIRIGQIVDWLYWIRELGFDISTLEKKAVALRKFFEFFSHRGYKVVDPWLIPLPPKKQTMPRVANEENYKKLLSVIPVKTNYYWHIRNRALITLLWDSGCRLGEVVSLDVPDLDFQRQRAVIKTEKSRGRRPFREIFWTSGTSANLQRWLDKRNNVIMGIEIRESDALFVGIKGGFKGKGTKGKRLAVGAAGEILRKYSKKAGLPVVLNAHSLRHHLGHELAKKGCNNSLISNVLGHSSLQSSYLYTQLYDKELEEEYRKYKGK